MRGMTVRFLIDTYIPTYQIFAKTGFRFSLGQAQPKNDSEFRRARNLENDYDDKMLFLG